MSMTPIKFAAFRIEGRLGTARAHLDAARAKRDKANETYWQGSVDGLERALDAIEDVQREMKRKPVTPQLQPIKVAP